MQPRTCCSDSAYCELGPFFLPNPTTATGGLSVFCNTYGSSTCAIWGSVAGSRCTRRTNVDESPVVFDALESTPLWELLLVLLGHLGGLAAHLTCTSQRSVDLACTRNHHSVQTVLGTSLQPGVSKNLPILASVQEMQVYLRGYAGVTADLQECCMGGRSRGTGGHFPCSVSRRQAAYSRGFVEASRKAAQCSP